MARVFGYIGTYTEGSGNSKGIYSFVMDADTGLIEDIHLAAESRNPAYLAVGPSRRFLYAVNEVASYDDRPHGMVSAYAVGLDGSLKFLNRKSSGGAGPCHISIHRGGNFAVAANYGEGTLGVLPIGEDGKLGNPVQIIRYQGSGPNEKRQEQAHAHSFTFAPDSANGFACDLGSDKVMLYRFDAKARAPLIPWEKPFAEAIPGCGPRHGVFHPKGNYAYVLDELKSTVEVYAYSEGRSFERTQVISSLPKRTGRTESIAAAIKIRADGKFVYASNRGHDSIAVLKVLSNGSLDFVEAVPSGGKHPRDFTLDPGGNYLLALNRDSDNLVVFKISQRTGTLKKEREYTVLTPTGIVFR
ncbi:MAG: lactonase family protein [Treponema sp.]|jgi:6-phosphogluconolactonase|nr:lactonase family protein [Treponema sp.]